MQSEFQKRLSILIGLLPRHSREEVFCDSEYSESRENIAIQLRKKIDISLQEERMLLDMVETILDSESTLDQNKLQNGEWQFVSYLAQLMGLSKLSTLADTYARDVEKEYWTYKRLAQESCLTEASKRLKTAEVNRWDSVHKEGGIPNPVRLSHVVWGFIKMDGRFLFHQKEDLGIGDHQLGTFVPVGGKMNENDFPGNLDSKERTHLMSNDSLATLHEEWWKNAMIREISEETAETLNGENGLEYKHDYTLSLFSPSIDSYVDHRGVGGVYSVVRYHFKLYSVELTLRGYLKLKKNVEINSRLKFATIEEMRNRKINEGKLDINALHDHYPEGFDVLAEKLDKMDNSFSMPYKKMGNKTGLIIPTAAGHALEIATTHDKFVEKMENLSQAECDLLLGFGAHARGWKLGDVPEGIELHVDGWVDATNNEDVRHELLKLVGKATDYFDVYDSNYFRLSVHPERIFFSPSVFSLIFDFSAKKRKLKLQVARPKIDTSLGCVESAENSKEVSRPYYQLIRDIADEKENVFWETDGVVSSLKRALEINKKEFSQSIGLRSIMKQENGYAIPTCTYMPQCKGGCPDENI